MPSRTILVDDLHYYCTWLDALAQTLICVYFYFAYYYAVSDDSLYTQTRRINHTQSIWKKTTLAQYIIYIFFGLDVSAARNSQIYRQHIFQCALYQCNRALYICLSSAGRIVCMWWGDCVYVGHIVSRTERSTYTYIFL